MQPSLREQAGFHIGKDQTLSDHGAPAACRHLTGQQIMARARKQVKPHKTFTVAGMCAPRWTCATATAP